MFETPTPEPPPASTEKPPVPAADGSQTSRATEGPLSTPTPGPPIGSSETPTPGADTERARLVEILQQEVNRLKFDTLEQKIILPNFDRNTGEDVRANELRQLELARDRMVTFAEKDMSSALGVRDGAKFSSRTGTPIPDKQLDERGVPTVDSLQARVVVFRGDIRTVVDKARNSGVAVPNFDSQTGEAIPPDSLRAFREASKRQTPTTETEQIGDETMGLNLLAEIQRVQREDEEARLRGGLPPRS